MEENQIDDRAVELHQQARQLGAAGDYEKALTLLAEAQSIEPDWPYPTYDMAFTYLLMQNFAKARDCYEETVKKSPRGFFTALTALDTLNREAAGDLPVGTYAAYMSLEWVDDVDQKAQMINSLTQQIPQFAPAWKEYAVQCADLTEKLDAIEKGLAAEPDAETKGVLLINKAFALNEQGDQASAKELLESIIQDPNSTFANENLARQVLPMMEG